MSEELDGTDMAIMARFNKRPAATLAGRRERETRPVARADRVATSNRQTKDRQLNLKVTAEFYDRVAALARNAQLSMPLLVERAIAFYADHAER